MLSRYIMLIRQSRTLLVSTYQLIKLLGAARGIFRKIGRTRLRLYGIFILCPDSSLVNGTNHYAHVGLGGLWKFLVVSRKFEQV